MKNGNRKWRNNEERNDNEIMKYSVAAAIVAAAAES